MRIALSNSQIRIKNTKSGILVLKSLLFLFSLCGNESRTLNPEEIVGYSC